MKIWVCSIIIALAAITSHAEEVIPNICSFNRPPHTERYNEGNDPGDNPFSMRSKAVIYRMADVIPPDAAEMCLSLRAIGVSIGDGKVITIEPVSDEQLKTAIPAFVAQKDRTNFTKVEETTLSGQRAFKMGMKKGSSRAIYWVRVRPNQVLEVELVGRNEARLASLRQWLTRLTIRVSDKPDPRPKVELASNHMQLGLTKEQMRERCGKPIESAGPHESFITERYFVAIRFEDTATSISYARINDSQKVATAINRQELSSQLLPMSKEEGDKILSEHTSEGRLTWSPVAPGRFRRTDGVMAAVTHNVVIIATAEEWKHIRVDGDAKKQ